MTKSKVWLTAENPLLVVYAFIVVYAPKMELNEFSSLVAKRYDIDILSMKHDALCISNIVIFT